RYHLGWNFERVDQDERGVRVQFSGGRVEHADILIGGDGIRSSVRAQMAPEVQPVYAGYYIWRGAPNEADLAAGTLNSIYPLFTFYLPKQQQVITYPIAGFNDDLTPGKRRFNFIWYRVADAAKLREMCVDETGVKHDYWVPPPLVRRDLIAGMHKDAKEILPPPLLDALMKIKPPFFTPIYDFTAPTITYGRVAMVGDAAANARPHMGFGMAKAGTDAQALAKHLRDHDDIDDALKAYNAERHPRCDGGRVEALQRGAPADRQQHRDAWSQARHASWRQSENRRRPAHARSAAKRWRHARLDRRAEFSRRIQMSNLPKPDHARNMRVVGHSDQDGRPDGVQIMVHRGYAYVGHMFSKGFSLIDVRDAKNARAVNFIAAPPNTWTIHLQTH